MSFISWYGAWAHSSRPGLKWQTEPDKRPVTQTWPQRTVGLPVALETEGMLPGEAAAGSSGGRSLGLRSSKTPPCRERSHETHHFVAKYFEELHKARC